MGKPRYKFAELVDIAQLQALMDRFSEVIGISNSIVDSDGTRLTSSGWEDACTHFHRANPASFRRCAASDTSLLDDSGGKTSFVIFRCPNGLIDTASPIIVEGEHLASVFTGQVLTEAPDIEFFRRQAQHFGYDEAAYLEAIKRVPRRSVEYIESATVLFSQLAGILAEIGLNRLRQVKAAEVLAELNKTLESKVAERTRELAEANAVLQSRETLFRQILDASSVAIFLLDQQGRIVQANQRMAEMFGRPAANLEGADYGSLVHPAEQNATQRRILHLLTQALPEIKDERLYRRADQTEFWGYLTGKRIFDADGSERGVVGVIADISERKYAEELIEKRIVALTQPLDGLPIALEDLFRREELQRIQDDFANAVGVSSAVTYPDGTPYTMTSNSSELCQGLIRKTEKGCANCIHSDAVIGRYHPEGPVVQPCMSGGLWDAGASITVGGRHVANWLIGQVRDETQSEESMRAYAREIGADEDEVVKAFEQITPMSRERFEKIAQALFTMANQLSTSAFQNIQQARAITELKEAEKKLQLAASVFTHAREGIMITTASGEIIEVNDAFTRITGYTRDEVLGRTPRILSSGRQEKPFYAGLWHDLTEKGHWYGEIWNRRKSGEVYAVMQTISAVSDASGIIGQYVALFSDITTLKEHQSQLEHIAHYDALTTLPNRVLLADRMR
ncbi:MAG: PocR ligand-binding domain-containing protein, partial [Propionivibrio sp.]|nr:PocR ligand-binding domain-containing protein [Propionivibrio sp.]